MGYTLYLVLVSSVSFFLFGLDKQRAKRKKRRVAERTLLLVSLVGGTVGSALGMLVWRHKTSKRSFLFKFGLLVAVQVVFLLAYAILQP